MRLPKLESEAAAKAWLDDDEAVKAWIDALEANTLSRVDDRRAYAEVTAAGARLETFPRSPSA